MVRNLYLNYLLFAFSYLVILLSIFACGSDLKFNLTKGYFYISEGGKNNAIIKLATASNDKEINISCSIEDYVYNSEFILILRNVQKEFDCLWPEGNKWNEKDESQYWIIVLKDDTVLGPLTYDSYKVKRQALKITNTLKLKSE